MAGTTNPIGNRSKIVLGALILLAGAGLWLSLFTADRTDPTPNMDGQRADKARERDSPRRPRDERPSGDVLQEIVFESGVAAGPGSLAGTVVDASNGAGIGGAAVSFREGGPDGGQGIYEVTTAEDGSFLFRPGDQTVSPTNTQKTGRQFSVVATTAPGFVPFAPRWGASPVSVFIRPEQALSGVRISLTPAVKYLVRVVDLKRNPIVGATVQAVSRDNPTGDGLEDFESTTTDESGQAQVAAPARGSITASHPDFETSSKRLDIVAKARGAVTIILQALKPGDRHTLSGIVLSPQNQPVPGAMVKIQSSVDNPLHQGGVGARTVFANSEGRWSKGNLLGGVYTLTASGGSYGPKSVRVPVPAGVPVTIRLQGAMGLRGRVHTTDDQPVAAFDVVVSDEESGLLEKQGTHYDPSGQFDVTGLRASPKVVVVRAEGYVPARLEGIDPKPWPPADNGVLEIELQSSPGVHGRITDEESGRPIEGAEVSPEGRRGARTGATALSDSDGVYVLKGLAPGLRSILVSAPGYHPQILSGVEVDTEDESGPFDAELAPVKPGENPSLTLTGIGAALTRDGTGLLVSQVVDGGGAFEANIVVGDLIVGIDGEDVMEMSLEDAVNRIRGRVDTVVELSLMRAETGDEDTIRVIRRQIRQ